MEQEVQRYVRGQLQALGHRHVAALFPLAKVIVDQERRGCVVLSGHADEAERVIAFDEAVRQPFRLGKKCGKIDHGATLGWGTRARNSLAPVQTVQYPELRGTVS